MKNDKKEKAEASKGQPKRAFAKSSEAVPGTALPSLGSDTQSMASLRAAFPTEDAEARALALEDVSDEVLLDYGVSIDSQSLLDSVPGFVASSIRIVTGLRPELASLILLDRGLFSVLVHQTALLEKTHARWVETSKFAANVRVRKGIDGAKVMADGLALRGRVSGALRSVLGPGESAVVDEAASGGEDKVPLAGGLSGLARLLEGLISGTKNARALERYGIGAQTLEALEHGATEVRSMAGEYSQAELKTQERELNLQDGRVLVVAEKVLRAFRMAHRSNAAVLLPALGSMAWRLSPRSGRKSAEAQREDAKKPPKKPVE